MVAVAPSAFRGRPATRRLIISRWTHTVILGCLHKFITDLTFISARNERVWLEQMSAHRWSVDSQGRGPDAWQWSISPTSATHARLYALPAEELDQNRSWQSHRERRTG